MRRCRLAVTDVALGLQQICRVDCIDCCPATILRVDANPITCLPCLLSHLWQLSVCCSLLFCCICKKSDYPSTLTCIVAITLCLSRHSHKINKLWCESTTNRVPVLRIAASRCFSELTKNVIRSSNGHSTPSLKTS